MSYYDICTVSNNSSSKTALGSTTAELSVPELTISNPCTRLDALSQATKNTSFDSSLSIGLNNSKKSLGQVIFFDGICECSG